MMTNLKVTEHLASKVRVKCPTCGTTDIPKLKRVGNNLGAYCTVCESYIQWVKQSLDYLALEKIQGK